MPRPTDSLFTGRLRRRLQIARENAFLDASCAGNSRLVKAFGLWCWKLKIPMVWFERRSPRSRYGLVHLEMLTTPHQLTGAGQAGLTALGDAQVSPHDAVWNNIPRQRLASVSHAAFRTAIQPEHYKPNRGAVKIDARKLRLLPRKASA